MTKYRIFDLLFLQNAAEFQILSLETTNINQSTKCSLNFVEKLFCVKASNCVEVCNQTNIVSNYSE